MTSVALQSSLWAKVGAPEETQKSHWQSLFSVENLNMGASVLNH